MESYIDSRWRYQSTGSDPRNKRVYSAENISNYELRHVSDWNRWVCNGHDDKVHKPLVTSTIDKRKEQAGLQYKNIGNDGFRHVSNLSRWVYKGQRDENYIDS